MNEIEIICNSEGELRLIVNPLEYEVRSKKQIEGYKKQFEKKKDNRHFNFANMENISEVISNLTNVHLGYLLHLQCFMNFEDGILTGKEGMKMTKKVDIQKTLCISKDTNKRFCKALENNGILEVTNGVYRINPMYHFSGKSHEQKVIKLFTTTLKNLCKTINPNELGFLYKLLPYVHLETNMICINPFERDPMKIQYLNIQTIAEITGIHKNKIQTLIRGLRKGGIIRESIGEDKRHTFITLNPYIFYRKSGQPDNTLKSMFASSPFSPKNR
ncbi:replication/maintenance protein RepL [Bacillus sp. B1-b2]|uniref:replication/maintenance protein RepL n=1 Tax=Bacillus sp. B1-b2 TaxID=2653201 RepID=UPI00186A7C78|nr:replication/maintenance protein RepL [Bacillus sp. B1-b2]